MTAGHSVDASFDAVGMGNSTFMPAVDALRKGGTTVVVAMYHEAATIDPGTFMVTEKGRTGSFAYTRDDFQAVIDAIDDGRLDPTPLITRRIRLDEILDQGIHLLLGGQRDTEVKILATQT